MPYIIIILVLAALDQITKQLMFNVSGGVQGFSIPIIDKFFHLTYVENHGGVFGLLQGKINLFTINDLGFGGWTKTQETYFADKAIFDQIYAPAK